MHIFRLKKQTKNAITSLILEFTLQFLHFRKILHGLWSHYENRLSETLKASVTTHTRSILQGLCSIETDHFVMMAPKMGTTLTTT